MFDWSASRLSHLHASLNLAAVLFYLGESLVLSDSSTLAYDIHCELKLPARLRHPTVRRLLKGHQHHLELFVGRLLSAWS